MGFGQFRAWILARDFAKQSVVLYVSLALLLQMPLLSGRVIEAAGLFLVHNCNRTKYSPDCAAGSHGQEKKFSGYDSFLWIFTGLTG